MENVPVWGDKHAVLDRQLPPNGLKEKTRCFQSQVGTHDILMLSNQAGHVGYSQNLFFYIVNG